MVIMRYDEIVYEPKQRLRHVNDAPVQTVLQMGSTVDHKQRQNRRIESDPST
jgi:hypothetical protein